MRIKGYLRGLGIGVLVTALIIGISSYRNSSSMTDEEIIRRAEELGMVMAEPGENMGTEGDGLPDDESVSDETEVNEETNQETINIEETIEETEETEEETEELEESVTVSEEIPEDTVDVVSENDSQAILSEITVRSGDSSYAVALKLEEMQFVDSADAFDTYLCDGGYATRIRVGTYQIPSGASYEEIAKIICGI